MFHRILTSACKKTTRFNSEVGADVSRAIMCSEVIPDLGEYFEENFFRHKFSCRFTARGHGAKGENQYEFSLEFLEPVKPEVWIIWFGIK